MSDEVLFGRECVRVNEVIAAMWGNMTRRSLSEMWWKLNLIHDFTRYDFWTCLVFVFSITIPFLYVYSLQLYG